MSLRMKCSMSISSMWILLLCLCMCDQVLGITLSDLYPYGVGEGDSVWAPPRGGSLSDRSRPVDLASEDVELKFFPGLSSTTVHINVHGPLSLTTADTSFNPLNLAFTNVEEPTRLVSLWSDLMMFDSNGARIFYRVSRDSVLLDRATTSVHTLLERSGISQPTFEAEWLLIITFYNISTHSQSQFVHTFQSVVAANNDTSYLLALLPDGAIDLNGISTSGERITSGYQQPQRHGFQAPCADQSLNPLQFNCTRTSNVGDNGLWVYAPPSENVCEFPPPPHPGTVSNMTSFVGGGTPSAVFTGTTIINECAASFSGRGLTRICKDDGLWHILSFDCAASLPNGEMEYIFFSQLATWSESQHRCQALGAQLAVPTNPDQLSRLATSSRGKSVWIGARKAANETGYHYVTTREPIPPNRAFISEASPVGPAEVCIFQNREEWSLAESCQNKYFFVCQIPQWKNCGNDGYLYALLRTYTLQLETAERVCNTHRGVLTRTLPAGCEFGDFTDSAITFNESDFNGEQHGFICQRQCQVGNFVCGETIYSLPNTFLAKEQARDFCISLGATLASDSSCARKIFGNNRHWVQEEKYHEPGFCTIFDQSNTLFDRSAMLFEKELCSKQERFICQQGFPEFFQLSKCGLYQYHTISSAQSVAWEAANDKCNRVGGWLATPLSTSERTCFEEMLTGNVHRSWTGFTDNLTLTDSHPFSSQLSSSSWWPSRYSNQSGSSESEQCWFAEYNNTLNNVTYNNELCTTERESAQVCQFVTWIGCGNLHYYTEYSILPRQLTWDRAQQACNEIGGLLAEEAPRGECLTKLAASLSTGMPQEYWRGAPVNEDGSLNNQSCLFQNGESSDYSDCESERPALCQRMKGNQCPAGCGCSPGSGKFDRCRTGYSTICNVCPANWVANRDGGSCYYFSEDVAKINWDRSAETCFSLAQDSHLIEIDNQMELEWVLTYMENRQPQQSSWIGLNNQSGILSWLASRRQYPEIGAGLPFAYTGDEDVSKCIKLVSNSSGLGVPAYEFTPCNEAYTFICELEIACQSGFMRNISKSENYTTCEDVDECALGTADCPRGELCVNTQGSFQCCSTTCPSGQFLDGAECRNCPCPAGQSVGCHPCTGVCICAEGYTGAGCDECVLGASGAIWTSTGCRESSVFFPFGPGQRDSTLPNVLLSAVTLTLPISFPFGGEYEQRLVKISSSGTLDFSVNNIPYYPRYESLSLSYVIAPFWSVTDGTRGTVFYNIHTSGAAVDRVFDAAERHFPNTTFPLPGATVYVLVVTWINSRHPGLPGRNSFQAVVATDGCVTLAFLNYDHSIEWIGSSDDGDRTAIVAIAQVGESLFSIEANKILDRKEQIVRPLTPACTGVRMKRAECVLKARNVQRLPPGFQPSCPNSLFLVLCDGQFVLTSFDRTLSRMCFANRHAQSINTVCCYQSWGMSNGVPFGALLFGGISGSFLTPYHRTEPEYTLTGVNLQQQCCEVSRCSVFYNVRPQPQVFFFILNFGGGFNDPHFQTLDGKSYTFNGHGEYILFDASDNTTRLQLQGRTSLVPQSTATVLSGAAIGFYADISSGSPTTRIEILLVGNLLHVTVDAVNLTGNVLAMEAGLVPLEPNQHLSVSYNFRNRTQFSFSNGVTLEFSVLAGNTVSMLSVSCSFTPSFLGNPSNRGLLGNLNNDSNDDFIARGGEMFPSNSTERQLFRFGQSYQLAVGEGLFYYPKGLNERNYSAINHMPVFSDELPLQNFSAEARAQCGNDRMCLFDSTETNDVNVGLQTANMENQFAIERAVAANPPPIITGSQSINATNGVLVQYMFNVTDPDDTFNLTLLGENQPPEYNILSTTTFGQSGIYVLSFVPGRTQVNVRIQARDSAGSFAEHRVASTLCPCENSQPCVEADPGVDGGDSGFTMLNCDCGEAWSGAFCELDRDECVDGNGCYPNVTCTDVPAPGTGVECGVCPSGLTGNGTSCQDINECDTGLHICQPNATCTNTFKSHNCTCGPTCIDINECDPGMNNSCSSNANCTNIPGSYECVCQVGYTGSGFQCTDIDDCQSMPCANGGTCIDGVANFSCICIPGVYGQLCQDFHVQVDLGVGFGRPFVTTFTEESTSVLLTLAHRANIVITDPDTSEICSLNITLRSTPEGQLDTDEFIFTTKAPPIGISLIATSKHHLFFTRTGSTNLSPNDWANIIANIEYFNNADEPSLATRWVETVAFLCSSNLQSRVAITELKIKRINDHRPQLLLRLP